MSLSKHQHKFGDPALRIAGLQLWVHGRQVPDAVHDDDRDWLRITAHCADKGASIWVSGALLQSWHFAQFAAGCTQLRDRLAGSAQLGGTEPELIARLDAVDAIGHIDLVVDITPDCVSQQHIFRFGGLDQTYLNEVIARCNDILNVYPTTIAS